MSARVKKILLVLLAVGLLAGGGRMQKALNGERARLGLTEGAVLKDAPPLLAFTTVALGGFRGLISNFLWIRANELQQQDKFFEMVQLADWITALEPHFAEVWAFESWNMAWNISVKFDNFADRWRWVLHGMELLRDDGLRYNPDNILLYQSLSWLFQSKMGENMDDADMYYKEQWAKMMTPFFGPEGTNFDQLIHPQTPEARTNALILREKYKINPVFAQKVNEEYGPLDWRLPEAHAIYWAAVGLEKAKAHPDKVKKEDLIKLRRSIYQSMLQAFYHGRLVINPFDKSLELFPDLALVPKLNQAFETLYAEESEPPQKTGMLTFQRNFLRDAVYFLYENDQVAEAAKWFKYLCRKFPHNNLINGDANSMPSQMTLDQYCVAAAQGDINDTSQNRVTTVVQGLLKRSYVNLAIGEDSRAAGFKLLAAKVYQNYETRIAVRKANLKRLALPTFADMNRTVLNQLLDPQHGLPYAARAVLRTQLGMPAETNAPSTLTNTVTSTVSTNAPALTQTNAAVSTGK